MSVVGVIANTFGGKVVWSFVSQFEVTEGLIVVALLVFLVIMVESSGLGFLFYSPILRRHVKPPLSHLFTLLAGVGTLSFALLVLCNTREWDSVLDINGWNLVQYPLSLFGYLGGSAMGENGRVGYGALALLIWTLTIVALSLGRGLAGALKRFAPPSILFLTVVVLLYDPGEMDVQAVNLVSGITYDGISLLSNWFLFTVSLLLTILDVMYEGLGKKGMFRLGRNRIIVRVEPN